MINSRNLSAKADQAHIEYVEVANALGAGGDMAQAITFYDDAVNAPPGDVVTRANALRNEAAIYYSLGQNATAHQDMMDAARLFTGHVVLAQSLIERSIAQAYLADTYYQISIKGCRVAIADVQAAAQALAGLGLNSPSDASLVALTAQDVTAVEAIRSSGGCGAAAHASQDYGAWAWSQGDMSHSIASGLGDTQAQAETAAVQACETAGGGSTGFGECSAHVWFENAYSSFAYASNGSWGYGWAKSSADADSVALSECKQAGGTDCAIAGPRPHAEPHIPLRGTGPAGPRMSYGVWAGSTYPLPPADCLASRHDQSRRWSRSQRNPATYPLPPADCLTSRHDQSRRWSRSQRDPGITRAARLCKSSLTHNPVPLKITLDFPGMSRSPDSSLMGKRL